MMEEFAIRRPCRFGVWSVVLLRIRAVHKVGRSQRRGLNFEVDLEAMRNSPHDAIWLFDVEMTLAADLGRMG